MTMANEHTSVWENVSLSRLALTGLWAFLMLGSGWGATVLEGRYPRGIAMVLLLVFVALFVRSFKNS